MAETFHNSVSAFSLGDRDDHASLFYPEGIIDYRAPPLNMFE